MGFGGFGGIAAEFEILQNAFFAERTCFLLRCAKLFGLIYENEKTTRSLEYAIDFLEMDKGDTFHQALNDAHYTAEILKKYRKIS